MRKYVKSANSSVEKIKGKPIMAIGENDAPWDKDLEFWYVTKHGLGPGMIPKDVRLIDVVEPDIYTTYVRLSRPLDHSEELRYELFPSSPNKTDIKASTNPDDDYFVVCEHCLMAIESREGNQAVTRDIPESRLYEVEDDWELWGTCDWCEEEYPESELYQIV